MSKSIHRWSVYVTQSYLRKHFPLAVQLLKHVQVVQVTNGHIIKSDFLCSCVVTPDMHLICFVKELYF